MIRKICIILVISMLVSPFVGMAQTSENKIGITPYVCDKIEIPIDAHNIMEKKLLQIATQNGFAAKSGNFILTANTLVSDKQVTPTQPAQYIVDMELSFYVADLKEGVILSEKSLHLRGIGRSEAKAFIGAINRVNPHSAPMREFMQTAREKIVDYYAQRVTVMLTKAESLTQRGEYKEALAVLNAIPDCVDEYPTVARRMVDVYQRMIDKFAQVSIQKAKAHLAVEKKEEALEALTYVDPQSRYFEEANRMIDDLRPDLQKELFVEYDQMVEQLASSSTEGDKEADKGINSETNTDTEKLGKAQAFADQVAQEEVDTVELEQQILDIIR